MDLGSIIKGMGMGKGGMGKPKGVAISVESATPVVTDEEGAAAVAELKSALEGDDDKLTWKKFTALVQLADKCEPEEMDELSEGTSD